MAGVNHIEVSPDKGDPFVGTSLNAYFIYKISDT